MKYLIKHWLNVDCLAEAIADESEINAHTKDLKEYQTPNSKFKFKMVEDSDKLLRTTFEQYDKKPNITSQDRTRSK
jgi:hypothetical protein|tara:strand:+ start:168 stop:395 length:228 start_codon:yes stop_codon:yes gene_type:complete